MPEPAEPTTARPADGGAVRGAPTVEEPTRAQAQHARRVAESRATIPDLGLTVTVDFTAAIELLAGYPAPAPTPEDLVLKALALALREAPRANGAYRDARFERYPRVNVAIALTAQGAPVFPVVFGADERVLTELAATTAALAARARDGALTHPELSGATATLTSLGEFGVGSVAPVLSQPQAVALGMGGVGPQAVVRDGRVVAREVVELTLVVDHRILHAPDAARLLRRVRELLEQPTLLTR